MSVETYKTLKHSLMTKAVRMFETPASMLGNRIFTAEEDWTETFKIDVVYGARHLATYRHPDAESGVQAQKQVKTIEVSPPPLSEKKRIPARVMKALREPGQEHQAWGKKKVAEEQADLRNIILNTVEKARWDLLQTGKVEQTAGDYRVSTDFVIAATHTPSLASTAMWSAAATAVAITDILGWKAIYEQDSGKVAKFGICGSTVMQYLMNMASVRALMGEGLKTETLLRGAIARMCGIELIQYDGGYKPLGGSFTPYIGADKFLLWSGDSFPEYYGIVDDNQANSPGWFSKSWEQQDPSATWVKVAAKCIPSGERIEELFCADVHT